MDLHRTAPSNDVTSRGKLGPTTRLWQYVAVSDTSPVSKHHRSDEGWERRREHACARVREGPADERDWCVRGVLLPQRLRDVDGSAGSMMDDGWMEGAG